MNGYINVAIIIIFLTSISWQIALISLAGVLLSALFIRLIKRESDKCSPIVHQAQEDMAGAVVEYVRGMGVIKSFGRTGAARESVERALLLSLTASPPWNMPIRSPCWTRADSCNWGPMRN